LEGWLWDRQCVGFGARRQRNSIFFYVRYRLNGSQIVKSIGRNGSPWTCDTARNEAKRLLGIVASGVDPFAQSLSSETFGAEVERYMVRQRNSLKPRSFIEDQRYLRKYAAPLHKLRLGNIDRRTIAVLLGQVETASGAVTRNRLRSSLSAFWSWAIAEGLSESNPVTGTAKADEGGSRDRVLTPEELRKLWRSLGEDKFSDVVRLLLLTAQRRTEIGKLAWSEIDVGRKLITLAADRVKNSRSHELPLSRQALAVIERYRRTTDFVFGGKGFQEWAVAKAALDQRAGIAPWRLHDLRRTAATGMAELGVQPHIIEAVLNHVSGHKAGVAGIYNRARYEGEMRDALTKWADHVEALIVGPRKQPVPIGLMERAFAVARGSKIVPEEDLANLARQLTPLKRA
jgi:integrase